ncbi:MAG: hypothetical protein K6G90_09415 [Clostridia bacterium]|nr:hypothetical protein [Clostridia bacterium]
MSVLIDFGTVTGKIKPLHGVNNSARKSDYGDLLDDFVKLKPPFSRLHDTAGVCGGGHYVDVANIFPDFSADENDPDSYDFLLTDRYILPISEAGINIMFRFGTTIEHEPRKYRIFPPADFGKWAKVCEHIVRHYNEGWADGFRLGIEYWEIWNEPDGLTPDIEPYGPPNWLGSAEDYYRLYAITAKTIKESHTDVKIGGYSSCFILGAYSDGRWREGDTGFFEGFLKYITAPETAAPLDFFSWHCYLSPDNFDKIRRECELVDTMLKRYSLDSALRFNTEWNVCVCDRETQDRRYEYYKNFRNEKGGANVLAAMIEMQCQKIDAAMYYDSQLWFEYGGLFDVPSLEKTPSYYALKNFSILYELGEECLTSSGKEVFALAAKNEDRSAFLLCNPGPEEKTVRLTVKGSDEVFDSYITDSKSPEKEYMQVHGTAELTLPPYSQILFLSPEG